MEEEEVRKRIANLEILTKTKEGIENLKTIESAVADNQTKTIRVGFFSAGTAGKTCIIKWFASDGVVEKPEHTIYDTVTRTWTHPNNEPVQYIVEEVGSSREYRPLLREMLGKVNIAVLCCRPTHNQTEDDLWKLVQETRESLYGRTVVFALTHKDIDDHSHKYRLFSQAYKTFKVSAKTGEGLPELWQFIGSHARKSYNPDYVKEKK